MTNSSRRSRLEQVFILLALLPPVALLASVLLLAITDLWVTILAVMQ